MVPSPLLLCILGLLWATTVVDGEEAVEDEPDEALLAAAARSSLLAWADAKRGRPDHRRRRRDEEVACYEGLGCFRDEGPFDLLDMLPLPPDKVGTKFFLYSRRNPGRGQPIHYTNASAVATNRAFRPHQNVKVIIHGFGSSCRRLWAREMKQALLRAEDTNIVCVDWETGASLPNYVQAAANTRLVGKQVARLVAELTNLGITDPRHIHLIGFSLGAHVAGFTGKEVANISRITGLDPAAPLFEGYGSRARLDPTDAMFVDVIHSNGDRLLKGGLGAFEAMGHVDFYPNGGKAQAGCNNFFIGAISDLFWYRSRSEEDGRSLCNHRRAYKFFTESIESDCQLRAFACDDFEAFMKGECFTCGVDGSQCANMGFYSDEVPQPSGNFYLLTRDTEPLCANQYKLEVQVAPGPHSTYGLLELLLFGPGDFNETFPLTGETEEIGAGKSLVKLVVAQPALAFAGRVQLKYNAYKGWIWRGDERLFLDKVRVADAYGRIFSFCSRGMLLQSGVPLSLNLVPADCQLDTRLVWSSTPPSTENEIPHDPSGLFPGQLQKGMPFPKNFDNPNHAVIGPSLIVPELVRFSPFANILPESIAFPPMPPVPLQDVPETPLKFSAQDGLNFVGFKQVPPPFEFHQQVFDPNRGQSALKIGNFSYNVAYPSHWNVLSSQQTHVGRSMRIDNTPNIPSSAEHQHNSPPKVIISAQDKIDSTAVQKLQYEEADKDSSADTSDDQHEIQFHSSLESGYHIDGSTMSPLVEILLKKLQADNDPIAREAPDRWAM